MLICALRPSDISWIEKVAGIIAFDQALIDLALAEPPANRYLENLFNVFSKYAKLTLDIIYGYRQFFPS